MKKINYNKERECNEDVFVMKKENDHMFLKMFTFKFQTSKKNYIEPGLSYDTSCKSTGCQLQKLIFLHEQLDSYEKLSHVIPVNYENF